MKIEKKFVFRVAGTLTAISLAVALLLAGVNELTAPTIRRIEEENTRAALQKVVAAQDAAFEPLALSDAARAAASAQGGTLSEAYRVAAGGETAGCAVKVTVSGSQGPIDMIVGVDAEGMVSGVSVVSSTETPNIGSKVVNNVNGVLDQFIGMSGAGTLAVGVNVDAISGATVSSRGVTNGVNAALAAAQVLASAPAA